jgi:CHAD domain-containing protein
MVRLMETVAYPEHDKLGPLGAKVSALHQPADLRKTLLDEFERAVQAARAAAAAVDRGSATAVHDTRKALRRARAVLSLVSPALPKSESRAVRRALQEARRALSALRDHAVAPETLGKLELADEERATARRVLDNAAAAMPAVDEIKQLLGESAARAAAQAEALAAALPQELDVAVLGEGISVIYAEARDARRASKRSKRWFHTWRRRSKELAYQLDLVASHAGARAQAIHDEIDGVTEFLSPAVDLIMLREFVATYAQGIPAEDTARLVASIDQRLADLMKDARKSGRDSFRLKPRRFAKRLAKAIKRDLTPADDAGASGEQAHD